MNALIEQRPLARILDVSEDEYHRDPCAVPSLNQTIAHTLVTKSPLHAWTEHPRLGGSQLDRESEDDTAALRAGKVIHKLLLGKGAEVAIIQADDFRKKFAKDAKQQALDAGLVPMLEHVYAEIVASVETIKGNLGSIGIEFNGESEVAIEWQEDGEHGPILCRGRMDHVNFDGGLILDVKKIRSAHPEMCGKHVIEYGYDIQDAAYTSGLSKLRSDLEGRVQMMFLFAEIDPPYAIFPGPLDGQLRELGRQRWERGYRLWERCLKRNHWPAYTDRITPIQGPSWAVSRWMEKAQDW